MIFLFDLIIYIYALSRRFYSKRHTVYSVYTFFIYFYFQIISLFSDLFHGLFIRHMLNYTGYNQK